MASTNHLTKILLSLNRESFNQFLFDMWELDSQDTPNDFFELKRKPRLGSGVIEQTFIHRDNPQAANSYQGFNLIVPFFQPIEHILRTNDISTLLSRERLILEKYQRALHRRVKNWYWPQDGELATSNIYFVSNMSGISKKTYLNRILPKLTGLVKDDAFFLGEIGIGTYDSFINKVPEKTEKVLKNLISKNQLETSLYYHEGRVFIEQHLPENFLQSGVLPGSKNPCDTVISLLPDNKIEVINEFEELLNKNFKEDELERFLKKYYKLIFGPHYDRIETQLWLRFPELDLNRKERRMDIFLRNAVYPDWELIELKSKGKIVSNINDAPTLSSRIIRALGQIRNYERILQQDKVKKQFYKDGIEYYEPQLRLVVGGSPEVTVDKWSRIKHEHEKGLKITTCSELLAEMRYRYNIVGPMITP